jgi:hypothetical protein
MAITSARPMSRQFLAIPVVAVMAGYGALVLWVASKGTGLAWLVLVLVSIGLAVLIGVFLVRRSRLRAGPFPQSKPPDDGFCRVLVVAGGTVPPSALGAALHEAASGRAIKAFVVAPVLSSRIDRLTGDQGAYDRANAGLESTLRDLEAMGADASGRVGSHDPVQAIADALQEVPAEAIVLTSNAHDGGRLGGRTVETVKRRAAVPVTHVVGDE